MRNRSDSRWSRCFHGRRLAPGGAGTWKQPLEPGENLVRLVIPIFREHQRNTPAECAEDRRLHQVTIQQTPVPIVGLRVHENAQLIFACVLVSHGEIASKPRLPEVTVHRISARFERSCASAATTASPVLTGASAFRASGFSFSRTLRAWAISPFEVASAYCRKFLRAFAPSLWSLVI